MTMDAIHRIRVGFMAELLLFQPAHGAISSITPDHEVIDGTWNGS
jgi:hypothetical protein